jgi:multisubunit Na+/H+ antiporter MnhG subunit
VGTERLGPIPKEKGLFIEIALFIVIGIACIAFILKNPHFLQIWLAPGKLKSVLGILFMLTLSPFGAHFIARVLTYFWELLNAISEIKRTKRSDKGAD